MSKKKNVKSPSKPPSALADSAPLNLTEEHVRMAREGRSKEVFELLLAKKGVEKEHKAKERP